MSALQRITSYATVFILLCTALITTTSLHAQAPEGINYQAVARNNSGDPLSNQIISVRFSVIANSTSGAVLYQEDHSAISTNEFGLFNLIIGQGSRTGGSLANFAAIDWSSGSRFLGVRVDAGSGFENLGTTQMLSVPYALYAKTSGSVSSNLKAGNGIIVRNDTIINSGDLSEKNELITSFSLLTGNILRITEATTDYDVDLTPLIPKSTDNQALRFSPNGDSILIENGAGIDIQFILDDIANNTSDIATNQTDISSNQTDIIALNTDLSTLQTNFSSDSTQTLQNQDSIAILEILIGNATDNQNLSIVGDSIVIERGTNIGIGFINTGISDNAADIVTNQNDITALNTDLSTLQTNFTSDSTLTLQNQDSIALLTTLVINDNDADSTNELIDSMRFVNRTLEIYQQGVAQTISFDTINDSRRLSLFNRTIANRDSIRILSTLIGNDNDTSASNEIQQLSLIADQLRIDDPSGLTNPAPIDLSIYNTSDNLGNHQLDSNLKLNSFYLSNDGDDEGLLIRSDGHSAFTSGLQLNSDQTALNYPLSIRAASSRVLEVTDAVTNAVEWDLNLVGGNLEFNETGVGAPLTLATGNRVGIATTTPDSTLTVNGGIKSTYFTMTDGAAVGNILTSDANGVATWQGASGNGIYDGTGLLSGNTEVTQGTNSLSFTSTATNAFSIDTTTFVVNAASNKVGIGTATLNSPTSLEINGTGIYGAGLELRNGGSRVSLSNDGTSLRFIKIDGITNTNMVIENATGEVGIGTTTPNYLLDVNGTFSANSINVNDEYTFPDTAGTIGQILQTDALGNPIWEDAPVSGGVFEKVAGVIRDTTADYSSDFVLGSPQLDDDGIVSHDNRMFFDKSQGAFRAGAATGVQWNIASVGLYSVAFGLDNVASASYSAVGGGQNNTASFSHAIVGGGQSNTASGSHSAIGGGFTNTVSGNRAFIGGGNTNNASGNESFIGGGQNNTASGFTSVISGGSGNTASGSSGSTVSGGTNNTAGDSNASVGGGSNNDATNNRSTIAGGSDNTASGAISFIGGGNNNTASDSLAMIGGGQENIASGNSSTIGGGFDNTASGTNSTIAGGDRNAASGDESFVGGGVRNSATATWSAVSGGAINSALRDGAFVGGGGTNIAGGVYSSILGGSGNRAQSLYEVVVGSFNDTLLPGFSPTAFNLTDRLFVIGNGTAGNVRSNALVMLKNGNTTLNGALTLSNGVSSFTLPNTDGTAGQTLQTNGSGTVTWVSQASTCPVGMTNVTGTSICIDTDERSASSTWFNAASTCAAAGYKLPTWAEWYGAVDNETLSNETNNWEWVDGGTSNTARKVGDMVETNTANDDPSNNAAFRCIYYK